MCALHRCGGIAGGRRLSTTGPWPRQAFALAGAVLVVDQATKAVALAMIDPFAPIPVLPFLNWVLVWNRGVSFGIGGGQGLPAGLFIGLSLAIVVGLALWLRRESSRVTALALGAVIGGALGNVLDRAVHGAVVDFIDLHVAGYHWPAFNIADSAIVLGAATLVLDGLLTRDRAPDLPS